MAALPSKHPVLGVGISATSYAQVAQLTESWVSDKASAARYVCACDVNTVLSGFYNSYVRRVLNAADIAAPDGMPVVWAMRSFGVESQQRVYGPDLMLFICEQAARLGHRLFLYGARDETLESLRQRLTGRFPGLQIAGMFSPPFRPLTPEEDAHCMQTIRESGADIVFVGLGAPKQETWMLEHRDRLPGLILFGVGAAFDFHAGRVQQAPPWMQRSGLEWFYRLTREPKRLWKRYLLVTTTFPPLWALQKLGILRYR